MKIDREIDGEEILTVITVKEAKALRAVLQHEYIPYYDEYVPVRALLHDVMDKLDRRGQ